jgi:hypothetical protein
MDNTPPLAANSAGLGELETKIDGLKARADAANASLDSLRLSIQRSTGGNLRSDMAVAQSSMKTNLAKAQQALAQKDAYRAAQFAKLCEQNLATIEDFLH